MTSLFDQVGMESAAEEFYEAMQAALIESPEPGVYPGIKMREYLLWDACNNSRLSDLLRSPYVCKWRMDNPEVEAEATDVSRLEGTAFGSFVHLAVLEPEQLAREYARVEGNWARKGPKDEVAEVRDSGRIPVKPRVWEAGKAIRENVWKHPVARRLVQNARAREISATWTDPGTGVLCKCRADLLSGPVVGDIKTTRDAAKFDRTAYEYNYYRSAPFYLDGLTALDQGVQAFAYIVIENQEPFEVSVKELDPGAMDLGRMEYRHLLDRYAEHMSTGIWPIASEAIDTVFLPKWATDEIERRVG